jgi:hypothetical protein
MATHRDWVALSVDKKSKETALRFVIFVIDDLSNSGTKAEMNTIDEFNESLRAANQWVFACGIGAPTTAAMIDGRGGNAEIVDRSLFRDADFYSGFWVIETDSPASAREQAIAASRACNRLVELRPLLG